MRSQPMDVSHLDETIEKYHKAVDELLRSHPAPLARSFSQHEDASLANPFGPVARGPKEIGRAIEQAANFFHDGMAAEFERLAAFACSDLAYIVEKEELRARLGTDREVKPFTLRVTTIFRREDDAWKVVHRHADPIVSQRPPQSVVQEEEKRKREDGVTI